MNFEDFLKRIDDKFPDYEFDSSMLLHIFASLSVIRDFENEEQEKIINQMKQNKN